MQAPKVIVSYRLHVLHFTFDLAVFRELIETRFVHKQDLTNFQLLLNHDKNSAKLVR